MRWIAQVGYDRLGRIAKNALALAILVGLGTQFARILSQLDLQRFPLAIHWELLVPAGLLYLLAQLSWGTFWVRLLKAEGVAATWYEGLRAYFVSQFGKYVPGKVMVIVMRVAMLRGRGSALPVGMTATYETLTSMGSGALVGVLLLPYLGVLPVSMSGKTTALLAVAALPILLGVVNAVAVRLIRAKWGPQARALPAPSLGLLAQGLVHGVCGWCLLGVSLGLVLQAVTEGGTSGSGPSSDAYLADLGAVALAYVAGFVILVAPGGLGVRELVLMEALVPRIADRFGMPAAQGVAAVVALLLRLSWSCAEVAVALALYFLRPRPRTGVDFP